MADQGGKAPEYVVHEGRNPGTYRSWSDTKAQVDGYSGNCYERIDGSSSKNYVVYRGEKPGVYDSWQKAHDQVCGYPNSSYERCDDLNLAKGRYSDYSRGQKK